jgi:putative exosortase-associated protein (TIGR04073 family)
MAATKTFTFNQTRVSCEQQLNFMRNVFPLLALFALVAAFTSGCAGPEEKLGRGIRNTCEVGRMGELRNSMEQTAVWDSPQEACTTGVIQGVDHSIARTGIGLYEIITFPFPPYHPVCTGYVAANPVYPDNYRPNLPSDPLFQTDQHIGVTEGNSFSFVPGSQFDVFGQ